MGDLDEIIVENIDNNEDYSIKNTQYETRKAIRTLPMNRVITKNNVDKYIGESTKYSTSIPGNAVKRKKKKSNNQISRVQHSSVIHSFPTGAEINTQMEQFNNVNNESLQIEDKNNDIPVMTPVSTPNTKINTNVCLKCYTIFIILIISGLIGYFIWRLIKKRKELNNNSNNNSTTENTQTGGNNKNKSNIRLRDAKGRFIKTK